MRWNAGAVILPLFAVLLVLVMFSAVGKADEKSAPADDLLHDVIASPKLRTITMEVTAYCPCKKCCGKSARGMTASGLKVTHNAGLFVAADTALLPFHTKLLV